jgi:putative SOS response-associated peptidase YedK
MVRQLKMCGRYSFAVEDELIRERFGVTVRSAIYKARYNCAPSQDLPVITGELPGELVFFRWGLIPSWAKDSTIGYRMINAKAETILEKPSFRSAVRSRRCLVPADGFYEWKKEKGKIPYRIVRKDRVPFAMAGIWERWAGRDGTVIHSFSIITTIPNELVEKIHDRMPVILRREDEQKWIGKTPEDEIISMLKPFPADLMESYPVSPLVNSPGNDSPDLIVPVDR